MKILPGAERWDGNPHSFGRDPVDALRQNAAVSSFNRNLVGADQRFVLRRPMLKRHAFKNATGIRKISSAKTPDRDLAVASLAQILYHACLRARTQTRAD